MSRAPFASLEEFQTEFNTVLQSYITERNTLSRYTTVAPLVQQVVDHTIHIALHGGKRLRPYMCMLAYQACGGANIDKVLKFSVALELFHVFALIHDDMIDKGKERHGIPTTHEFVREVISSYPRGDSQHLGNSFGVLAGDIIFSWSYELVMKSDISEVQQIFAQMIDEVLVGQMLDVSLMTQVHVPPEVLAKKNELKTALYSFVNPMLIGHAFAEAEQQGQRCPQQHSTTEVLKELGIAIGQAFQIQDDMLDIVGNPAKTGKQNFLDIEDGQHTMITQYVFDHGSEEDIATLKDSFGVSLDEDKRNKLRAVLDKQAVPFAQKAIQTYITEAHEVLDRTGFDMQSRTQFATLLDIIQKRVS
ncbi:MAG: hypothetical protein RIQ72_628 [Candidatus Parcubacteria bacterium]